MAPKFGGRRAQIFFPASVELGNFSNQPRTPTAYFSVLNTGIVALKKPTKRKEKEPTVPSSVFENAG
jgi:hypothetical protein